MKFHSAIDSLFKSNLVLCLTHRAYKICSTYQSLCAELENLRKYFSCNSFSLQFIETRFNKYLQNKFNKPCPVTSVSKKIVYISIPYINQSVNSFTRKELRRMADKFYPQLQVRIIFKNTFSIASFFKYKDRTPDCVRSCVVYLFTCGQCNSTYCGETTRHFHTRTAEHRMVSARTGRHLSSLPYSSIFNHSIEQNHPINSNDFKVIGSFQKYELKTAESI